MNRRNSRGTGGGVLPLAAKEAGRELGPTITDFEIHTASRLTGKQASFFIDDVIWIFRDLARQRPKSIFDHAFLGGLREAHDKYGLKLQLNLFYRTDFFYGMDAFTLADMTDAYQAEWQGAKDWLKFGFHSLQEFPDYPFINAEYDDVKRVWDLITGEIRRFAGEGTFARAVVPHWGPMSKDGCRALKDCGAKVAWVSDGPRDAYDGDASRLPYGHSFRVEHNRKPETALYRRGTANVAIDASASGYNHLSTEQAKLTTGTFKALHDRVTGLNFKKFSNGPCLNLHPIETLEGEFAKVLGKAFICFGDHEQYFYRDYFAYQPDYVEKILVGSRILHDNGYAFIFIEDTVD